MRIDFCNRWNIRLAILKSWRNSHIIEIIDNDKKNHASIHLSSDEIRQLHKQLTEYLKAQTNG